MGDFAAGWQDTGGGAGLVTEAVCLPFPPNMFPSALVTLNHLPPTAMVFFLAAAALGASYLLYRSMQEGPPPVLGECLACMESVSSSWAYQLESEESGLLSYLEGVQLPCPGSHVFCKGCLRSYLLQRLRNALNGESTVVSRCPACPGDAWRMSEQYAATVLQKEEMDEWRQQQYLDKIEKIYCPNPRCSEALQLEAGCRSSQKAACPLCKTLICIPCRSFAHKGMSCARWQSSTKSLGASDLGLRKLAQKLQLRRCPRCRTLMERNEGCKHMTCRCGHQFCYLCGSDWWYECTKGKDCESFQIDGTLRPPNKWSLLRMDATNALKNSARKTKNVLSRFKPLKRQSNEAET